MSTHPQIGIIGGSGLYGMAGLEDVEEKNVSTPFGDPSSPLVVGTLEGRRLAFLARHGIGHIYTPSEVNYRANIYAMKSIGVERLVSISACGSLREDFAPGHLVIPHQLFDFTKGQRQYSFFGEEFVAHIGVADPFCEQFSDHVFSAVEQTKATAHQGGTCITIEGPRFSTRGESNVYRSWDMDLIGMTASPEAFLAREAELCYAAIFHVTDYDVWHTTEEPVSVQQVIKVLNQNTEHAQQAIRNLVKNYNPDKTCNCASALASALITPSEKIPAKTRKKLDLLVGKYLD